MLDCVVLDPYFRLFRMFSLSLSHKYLALFYIPTGRHMLLKVCDKPAGHYLPSTVFDSLRLVETIVKRQGKYLTLICQLARNRTSIEC